MVKDVIAKFAGSQRAGHVQKAVFIIFCSHFLFPGLIVITPSTKKAHAGQLVNRRKWKVGLRWPQNVMEAGTWPLRGDQRRSNTSRNRVRDLKSTDLIVILWLSKYRNTILFDVLYSLPSQGGSWAICSDMQSRRICQKKSALVYTIWLYYLAYLLDYTYLVALLSLSKISATLCILDVNLLAGVSLLW